MSQVLEDAALAYLNNVAHGNTFHQVRRNVGILQSGRTNNLTKLHGANVFEFTTKTTEGGSLAPNNEDTLKREGEEEDKKVRQNTFETLTTILPFTKEAILYFKV